MALDDAPQRNPDDTRLAADVSKLTGLLDMTNLVSLAAQAVRLYAESHPRPSCVTQDQAAEMLGISGPTVRKLIRAGQLRLNGLGKIPVSEIDRLLEARAA